MRPPFSVIAIGLLLLLAVGGAAMSGVNAAFLADVPVVEAKVRDIPLSGPLSVKQAEVSGMAWRGEQLVILPQYPEKHGGAVFAIARADIDAYLAGRRRTSLEARVVPFSAPGLIERIPGYEGFEAIVFDGDEVFLTVEATSQKVTRGYLVSGRVEPGLAGIQLDAGSLRPLAPQTKIDNLGYEALTMQGDEVVALYEANGKVNGAPTAYSLDRGLRTAKPLALDHLEYRITDATSVDESGRFWAANYHWPGTEWASGSCPLTARFGVGKTHSTCRTVERLVELEMTSSAIRITDTPPILLELIDDANARNWEAVVRYGKNGFLVMTDEHPASILGYVERPRTK